MEKYNAWEEKIAQHERGEISDEELDRFQKSMGFDDPETLKINQEFSLFKDLYKSTYGWIGVPDKDGNPISNPTGEKIWESFERFRKDKLQEEEWAKKKTEGEYSVNGEGKSRDQIIKMIKDKDPSASKEVIEETLKKYKVQG